ncbi:hypothetical protein TRICI_006273 [Trichomonascus ciferrii]|uniref:Arrestin-like N-terminal domain-containing protein n=1 Tax=Trichomonascus ciferrii TaxID=44093 RepID=A0A642UJ03_9ASCO|nr:hypothetical protein TRICI_006273 [Trichomonascus ciferrii]
MGKLAAVVICEMDMNAPPGYTEQDMLPAYGIKYRARDLGPLGCRRRRQFEIVLVDNKELFNVGDVVNGRVYVRPLARDIMFEQLSIELILAESVVTGEGFVERRLTRRFSLAQFTVFGELLEGGIFRKGIEYEFPFSLTIPRTNPYNCSATNGHHTQHSLLPPSIGPPYGTEYDIPRDEDLSNLSLRLNYYVRGQINHQGNTQTTETFAPFRFIPSYPVSSYSPVDEKHTCSSHQEVSSGKFLKKKRTLGTVTLTVPQAPKILSLGQTCKLNLYLTSDLTFSITQVTYKLLSRTTVVRYRAKEIVTTSHNNALTSQQTVLEHKLDASVQATNTHFELPVLLPENHPHVVPSFSTCMSSRAYSLEVSVILRAGQIKTSVQVCLPVTLVWLI